MSLLTSSTYAGPDEPLWAVAGSGGGGGGVSSVTASGAGITASPTTGAVVVANTGVTSLIAGAGISVSSASGAVTVANTATAPSYNGFQTYSFTIGVDNAIPVTGTCGTINLGTGNVGDGPLLFQNATGGTGWNMIHRLVLTNASFNSNTRVIITNFRSASVSGGGLTTNFNSYSGSSLYGTFGALPAGLLVNITGSDAVPNQTTAIQYSVDFFIVQFNP